MQHTDGGKVMTEHTQWNKCIMEENDGGRYTRWNINLLSGVALTFEKLRIANAQHGKNCRSSPAAKATISTDLPKIDKHENTNV